MAAKPGSLPEVWPPKPEPENPAPTCCGHMSCFSAGKCRSAMTSVVNFLYLPLRHSWLCSPSFQSCLLILLAKGCPGVQVLPPSLRPPWGAGPFLTVFCLLFYLLPYLILKRLTCLFGGLGPSASIQKVFCSCSACSFWYICQGRRWSPCLIPPLSWSRSLILNIGLQGETYTSLCLWEVNVLPDLPRAFCVCVCVCVFWKPDFCHTAVWSKLSGFYFGDILSHSFMGKPLVSYWLESLLIYILLRGKWWILLNWKSV